MAGFMQLHVWRDGAYLTDEGYVLTSIEAQDHTGNAEPIGDRYFAHYTAPGYMDCTDHVQGKSVREVVLECLSLYGDDEHDSDDRREAAQVLWQGRHLPKL